MKNFHQDSNDSGSVAEQTHVGTSAVLLPFSQRIRNPDSFRSSPSLGLPLLPPSVVSHNPSTFTPPFNVVEELTENRSRYVGREGVGFHGFPSYLLTCLDSVREQVSSRSLSPTSASLHNQTSRSTRRPGISPTIACCVAYGVAVIEADPDIQATFELRSRLYEMQSGVKKMDADEAEELAAWFRSFPLSLPDNTTAGARRINSTMPEQLKIDLTELAMELGCSVSSLGTMAMAVTLADQPWIHSERKRDLERAVLRFFGRVRIRYRVAEKWLVELEERGIGKSRTR